MKLKEFRIKYPQYNDLADVPLTEMVNAKRPGTIDREFYLTASPPKEEVGEYVEKLDPRRMLKKYAYRKGLAPSDVARHQSEYYFKMNMPESEARQRVTIAMPSNPIVKNLREKFPMYNDMDDITFMDAVTTKYPEYNDVLQDLRGKEKEMYEKIDLIEQKKAMGWGLDADEAFINLTAIPEEGKRIGQQFFLSYGNMASFGAQNYVLNKMGFDQTRPDPDKGMEAVAAGAGSLAAFIHSPLKLSQAVVTRIPGLARLWAPINASSRAERLLKPILRSGITLGTADLLLMPPDAYKEGMVQAGERVNSFGGGFMFGAGAGAIGYVPNRAARMISSSLFFGLPATLQEATLEEQVFQYGFGAYAGIHGTREMIKNEDLLRKTIEKGVTDPRGREQLLKRSDELLGELETMMHQEGTPYFSVLDSGRRHYVPIYKGWRAEKMLYVKRRLRELKKDPSFKLRNDKLTWMVDELKTTKIDTLTDAQLFNAAEHVKPENISPAPTRQFVTRPPSRPGSPSGKHISVWHQMARLGHQSMEHLGFGGMFEEGMTGNVFRSDVKYSKVLNLHRQLTNNWKRIAGVNKESARRIFLHRDGKLDLAKLADSHPEYQGELKVSMQMERYLKTMLELQNRHRSKYGQKPIKPVEGSYITHIFDSLIKQTHQEKYPFPDYLADIMEFITPKEAGQPYLKKRRGGTGYRENVWAALDAYGYRAGDYVADDGLRQANRIVKWLGAEIRVDEKMGKQSPIDLIGVKKNVQNWANLYAGRPGKVDILIKDAMKNLPPSIKQHVHSAEAISATWRTIMYTGYMGWRPKLAIRNLGQHSLALAMTGPKHLWQAIATRNAPAAQALLKESLVLQTREMGFAPELPQVMGTGGGAEEMKRSAFYMFKKADRINVEDAFLAGYYEARSRKLPHDKAIKAGDHVAGVSQYLYTKGNRGPISNLWGMSSSVGKIASMFTTWPINKMEYDLMMVDAAKKGNYKWLLRYLGVVGAGALTSLASSGKFRSSAYTGAGAEVALFQRVGQGLFGAPTKPDLLLGKDIRNGLENDELWKLILYDIKQNTPFWQKF